LWRSQVVQEAEGTAKSKCLPVTGMIGLHNPTRNSADLLKVFPGKASEEPMNVLHSITSHYEKSSDQDLATQWNSIHLKRYKGLCNRLHARIAKAVVERKCHSFTTAT